MLMLPLFGILFYCVVFSFFAMYQPKTAVGIILYILFFPVILGTTLYLTLWLGTL